jgi:hypothetical protein
MRGWSSYGCGIMLLGVRRSDDGLETTRWLTLFFLPLVPLSRWRVRYVGVPIGSGQDDPTFEFEPLERLPLDLEGTSRTFLSGWTLGAIALTPAAACVFGIQGAANNWQMALVFASCVWPLVVLLWVMRRWTKLVRSGSAL